MITDQEIYQAIHNQAFDFCHIFGNRKTTDTSTLFYPLFEAWLLRIGNLFLFRIPVSRKLLVVLMKERKRKESVWDNSSGEDETSCFLQEVYRQTEDKERTSQTSLETLTEITLRLRWCFFGCFHLLLKVIYVGGNTIDCSISFPCFPPLQLINVSSRSHCLSFKRYQSSMKKDTDQKLLPLFILWQQKKKMEREKRREEKLGHEHHHHPHQLPMVLIVTSFIKSHTCHYRLRREDDCL